ncbi:hypothetical protein BDZ97DRAFT_1654578 [Flammula alnicola]|nr:hypothetical protein BDZ97DRAFT_1654578 [Flammula alnicola]
MAFPQSFSTTAECPFMENSPSTLTVRLSTSSSPVVPSTSRFVSFSTDVEGTPRSRSQTESVLTNRTSSPPGQSRNRFAPGRMSHSGSISSLLMSVRPKSKSKSTASAPERRPETVTMESSTSWFGKARDFIRPWEDDDDEGVSIPEEQKRAFSQTRDAVCETLKRMVGFSGKVVLEILVLSMEAMEYVPEPALQGIAKTFLAIWKAVQHIAMNRLAFLRLTQTCTTILDSICNEVEAAGDDVAKELSGPILVLERSFESFLSLIRSQIEMPFLARYLKRDETTKAIASCNDSLLKALALFTNTIQIRTLSAVCANFRLGIANHDQLMAKLDQTLNGQRSSSHPRPMELKRCSAPELDAFPSASSNRTLGISASPTIVSRSTDDLLPQPQVVPVLQELQTVQNLHDEECDVEDLERSIKDVLKTGDDAKLLSFLGVEPADMPEAMKTLQRTLEARAIPKNGISKDILHQEFLECGVEALRRLTTGNNLVANLPVWTITQYEVVRGKKIGMGSFSQVFQGTWKGRVVAIKLLSEVTPYDLFVREIKVWKTLKHPNVLKLYGASSATANPPWFFVSPYMENNTLVHFLKRLSHREEYEVHGLGPIAENLPCSRSRSSYGGTFFRLLKVADVYRILQDIARGMEYLHFRNVLHGDLKASNVLVDKNYRCVISDFGQSEMKSEVCRITGSSMQSGTLRWKAPELLDGSCMLTPATDVYAFAIVCIEVLTMGDLPWGQDTDDAIRINVLERDKRPLIPVDFTSPLLHELIEACWDRDPDKRSPFSQTVARLVRLRSIAGDGEDPSVLSDDETSLLSPPTSPSFASPRPTSPTPTPHSNSVEVFDSSDDYVALPSPKEVDALRMEENMPFGIMKMPEPVYYLPNMQIRPANAEGTASDSDSDLTRTTERACRSPPPLNESVAEARNERRYRYLLEHEFNASLTLPLWDPSPVQVGDVGYFLKPSGTFVSLFNALKPHKIPGGLLGDLPSMASYGNVSKGNIRMDKRNVAQKGRDVFSGLLAFRPRNELPVARRHSFRLRAGHKCAHIYTELAEYHYMKKLDAPKAWFQANADFILNFYGQGHNIQKEDLFLVISLLQAPNYALFVSHRHPDGQAHFNVFSGSKKGQPWGNVTTDTNVPGGRNGPSYEESSPEEHEHAVKISNAHDPPKAVLIGRLRFKPDSMEPTTAK